MKDENMVVIELQDHCSGKQMDLEVELDITALELFEGLNTALHWGRNIQEVGECYLAAENPIALLQGGRTLREFGLRDGSVIHYMRH